MDFGVFSISLVIASLALYTAENGPHIIKGPDVNANMGGDFTLNCKLSPSNMNVVQVEWLWRSSEKAEKKIVVFHEKFGTSYRSLKFRDRVTYFNHSQSHVSIRVTEVTMNDTGNYTCQYTTYPSGNFKATTTVTVTDHPLGVSLWIPGTVMAALLFSVLLAASVYFALKHAQKKTNAGSRPDQTTNDQDKDLNYAEIGHFRKAGGTKVPQSKTDVEYGEVVFPSQPSSTHSPVGQPNMDRDMTYAEVKRP